MDSQINTFFKLKQTFQSKNFLRIKQICTFSSFIVLNYQRTNLNLNYIIINTLTLYIYGLSSISRENYTVKYYTKLQNFYRYFKKKI